MLVVQSEISRMFVVQIRNKQDVCGTNREISRMLVVHIKKRVFGFHQTPSYQKFYLFYKPIERFALYVLFIPGNTPNLSAAAR